MKIGTSKKCITTKLPVYLAGFDTDTRNFVGEKHDDIFIRAVALIGKKPVIIVAGDALAFSRDLADKTAEKITEATGVPREAILFNASHTHSAPQASPLVSPGIGPYLDEYGEFFYKTAEEAAIEAFRTAEEGVVTYHTAEANGISVNRRLVVNGECRFAPNLTGIVNNELTVIKAVCGGKTKALICEFACHPSTIGDDMITSDYPGAGMRFLEEENEGLTALFIQGCCGNIRVRSLNESKTGFDSATYDNVLEYGRLLHDAAVKAASSAGKPVSDDISCILDRFEIGMKPKRTRREYAQEMVFSKDLCTRVAAARYYDRYNELPETTPFSVQRITLGDTLELVALEGEVCIEFDYSIKAMAPGKHVAVAGYSNGMAGYICTEAMYDEGGYEPDRSASCYYAREGFLPDTEKLILAHAKSILEK